VGKKGGPMILSIKFSTDFDKILIEDTVEMLQKLDVEGKALVGEAFIRGMLFVMYHTEASSDKH
jgi:hypothetical protein